MHRFEYAGTLSGVGGDCISAQRLICIYLDPEVKLNTTICSLPWRRFRSAFKYLLCGHLNNTTNRGFYAANILSVKGFHHHNTAKICVLKKITIIKIHLTKKNSQNFYKYLSPRFSQQDVGEAAVRVAAQQERKDNCHSRVQVLEYIHSVLAVWINTLLRLKISPKELQQGRCAPA